WIIQHRNALEPPLPKPPRATILPVRTPRQRLTHAGHEPRQARQPPATFVHSLRIRPQHVHLPRIWLERPVPVPTTKRKTGPAPGHLVVAPLGGQIGPGPQEQMDM